MATPSGILDAVGLKDLQIFALTSTGYPNATSTTFYEGIDVSGVKELTFNAPESRQIVHVGDDRVFNLDTLPPTEPISGELTVGKINNTVDAALTGQLSFTIGDSKMFGAGTDKQGSEAQVAILAFQQAQEADPADSNYGRRIWQWVMMPKGYLIPKIASMNNNPAEQAYTIRPQVVNRHLWQIAYSNATEGFTQAQIIRGVSEYRPKVVAFLGNNSTTTFTLPTTSPVVSTAAAKMYVAVNGVVSAGYTFTTSTIVFTTAPTTSAYIVAWYETASED